MLLNRMRKIARKIAATKFARRALDGDPSFHPFEKKPSAKVMIGILLMAVSHIIGWPMMAVCGALSIYWKSPLIAIVGVPSLFVVTHLFFLAGVYLAGGKYLLPLIRWITRIILKKMT
jgi:hypothetical protein